MQIEHKTIDELERMAEQGPLHGVFHVYDEDYHAFKAISSTALKAGLISMAHFKECWEPDEEAPPTKPHKAFEFGTMLHAYMLEPVEFSNRYVAHPGMSLATKEGREWKKDIAKGRRVIDAYEAYSLRRMRANIKKNPHWKSAQRGQHENELACFWVDQATNLQCKAKFDRVVFDQGILDIKTTSKPLTKWSLRYAIKNYGYHIQHAHYLSGLREVLPDVPQVFKMVWSEKNAPFESATTVLEGESEQAAFEEYDNLMVDVAYAIMNDSYPGPSNQGLMEIEL